METIQKYLITCLIAEEERETKGDLPCLNFFSANRQELGTQSRNRYGFGYPNNILVTRLKQLPTKRKFCVPVQVSELEQGCEHLR